jgi:ABC-type uncharacterized transport system involved in gliding motility auxiliary subunit
MALRMNNNSQNKFISIIGLTGLVILGISLAVYLIQDSFAAWLKVSLSVGVILCLVYVGYNWEEIRKKIFSKQTLGGTNTTVYILVVLAILVLVNYLGGRHYKRFDVTKSGRYTLSDQTRKLVTQLKDPLQIHYFYTQNNPNYNSVKELLQEYVSLSNKIKIQGVDPDVSPGLAQEYQAHDGNSILEYQGRKETVTGFDEQDFSTAILKLLNKGTKKIYFLTGHGESDLESADQLGYDSLKTELEKENHVVAPLSLANQTTLPLDMSVLVIAGPKTELFAGEVTVLKNYLNTGGRALILLNPPASASLSNLIGDRGIHADADIIVDPVSSLIGGDVLAPVIQVESYNDITRGLSAMVFPYSRSLSLDSGLPPSVITDILLQTRENSWGKTDLKSKSAQFDPQKDIKGPLTLGISYQATAVSANSKDTTQPVPQTRLIVIGNANFAANAFLNQGGNRDLFLNSINWLTGDTQLLGIRAKEPDNHEMLLLPFESRLIIFTTLLFIPGLIVLCGIIVWIRRRS